MASSAPASIEQIKAAMARTNKIGPGTLYDNLQKIGRSRWGGAEFHRFLDQVREAGLDTARQDGRIGGRRPKLTPT